jgi:AMMECR1 domain-containing protein
MMVTIPEHDAELADRTAGSVRALRGALAHHAPVEPLSVEEMDAATAAAVAEGCGSTDADA